VSGVSCDESQNLQKSREILVWYESSNNGGTYGTHALIKNLDKRIREETGLPVSIADDPLASVVLGTGKMLSDFKLLRKISIDYA